VVKYGIIGCGSAFAQNHLEPMKQIAGLHIAALADTDAGRLDELSKSLGVRDVYTDYREMLARAGIDAVLIALPPTLNRDAAAQAARAGRHILLEKPIATTLEAARDIIDTCAAHRVKLCIGHQRRYASTERRAKEILAAGRLGRLFRVKVRHTTDCVSWLNGQAGWRTDAAVAGGGIWLLWGVHYTDLLRWLTGVEAVSVFARVRNVACPDIATEDDAFALVEMTEGIFGEVEVSAARRAVEPAAHGPVGEMVEIYGSEGTLVWSRTEGVLRLATKHGTDVITVPGGREDWGDAERRLHEAFVDCIERDLEPPVTGDDGLRALEIVLAGYRSSDEGCAVPLRTPGVGGGS